MPETVAGQNPVSSEDLRRISLRLVSEAIGNIPESERQNTSPVDLASRVFGNLAVDRELLQRKLEESSSDLFRINKRIDQGIQQAAIRHGSNGYDAYVVAAHAIRDYMLSKFRAAWPAVNLICENHEGFCRGNHICIYEEPVGRWQKFCNFFRLGGENRVASLWYSNDYNGVFKVELNFSAAINGLETIATEIAGIVNDSKLGNSYRCHGHPLKMEVSVTNRF